MTSFRFAFHSLNGRRIVEVWEGDEFIAGIYPHDRKPRVFRIVTKHPLQVQQEDGLPHACEVTIGQPQ